MEDQHVWYSSEINQQNTLNYYKDVQQLEYIPSLVPYAPYNPIVFPESNPKSNTKSKVKKSASTKKPRKNVEQNIDPLEETLWDVVVKNKRVATTEEIAARKTAKLSQEQPVEPVDALESLLDISKPTEQLKEKVDLFDICTTNSSRNSETLKLSEDGSFIIEKSMQQTLDNCDFLLEGKSIINEDYSKSKPIQQYDKAYKHTKAAQWTEKDLVEFFKAIETFGLDFLMIQTLLPQFTIKQLRSKYKAQEKKYNEKVEAAIYSKRTLDVKQFEKLHGPIDVTTHYQIQDSIEDKLLCLESDNQSIQVFDNELRAPTEDDIFSGNHNHSEKPSCSTFGADAFLRGALTGAVFGAYFCNANVRRVNSICKTAFGLGTWNYLTIATTCVSSNKYNLKYPYDSLIGGLTSGVFLELYLRRVLKTPSAKLLGLLGSVGVSCWVSHSTPKIDSSDKLSL